MIEHSVDTTRLWSLSNTPPLALSQASSALEARPCVAFSADGTQVAHASGRGLHLLSLPSREVISTMALSAAQERVPWRATDVALSVDVATSKTRVALHLSHPAGERCVLLQTLPMQAPAIVFTPDDESYRVALSPNGEHIVTHGGRDITLWSLHGEDRPQARFTLSAQAWHVAFDHGLALTGEDGWLVARSLKRGERLADFGCGAPVRRVAFSASSRQVIGATEHEVIAWSLDASAPRLRVASTCGFSLNDAAGLLTVMSDGTLELYDLERGQRLATLPHSKHPDHTTTRRGFSADGFSWVERTTERVFVWPFLLP